jgi:hypothetical protein
MARYIAFGLPTSNGDDLYLFVPRLRKTVPLLELAGFQ